jgi:hypothetical protein
MRSLPGSSRRPAYTLLELTVVIFIIVSLMALSAGAVIKFMAVQQTSNTRTTLDRTQGKLNKAWSAVKDQAYRETIPSSVQTWIQQNLAGGDVNSVGRARVIYLKLRLRQVFPMSFDEALNNNVPVGYPLLPLAAYQTYLNSLGIVGTTPATAQYESSACLLMALQRFQSGSGVDASDLTTGGATGSLSLTSGKTIPYLTDAWNQPLYFARFPTGSLLLNPNGAWSGQNKDPGDPQGYLQTPQWGTTFGPVFTALTLQTLAPGNASYMLAPMLVSSGPNLKLEANPITFAPTIPGDLGDDLYSTP